MAMFPCGICGQRYAGPQQTAYCTIVHGGLSFRERVRLCPKDLVVLSEWLAENAAQIGTPLAGYDCANCAGPDGPLAVFVTIYRTGREREDWYARSHGGDCLIVVANTLYGPANEAQAALEPADDVQVVSGR